MPQRRFSEHFLRFRFEYAALVWDCAAASMSNAYRWHARLLALLGLPLLLILPAAILAVGAHPFGNAYAFTAALVLWPFLSEIPGRQVRRAEVTGVQAGDPGNFDFFLLVGFTVLAVVDQILLLFILDLKHVSAVALGVLWGIALAGGLDFARSAISSFLAMTKGYPLYGNRPLKPDRR